MSGKRPQHIKFTGVNFFLVHMNCPSFVIENGKVNETVIALGVFPAPSCDTL